MPNQHNISNPEKESNHHEPKTAKSRHVTPTQPKNPASNVKNSFPKDGTWVFGSAPGQVDKT